jgi:vacuolar-type H+-ATPase subunit I/STV1
MRINRGYLKSQIEKNIFEAVVNSEEIDLTVNKIMDDIEVLILAAETNCNSEVVSKINRLIKQKENNESV